MTEPVYDDIKGVPKGTVVTQFGSPISPTKAVLGLKEGQSFVVDTDAGRRSVISAAYRLNINIVTRKEGERYRISLK